MNFPKIGKQWRDVYSERGKYGSERGLNKPTGERQRGGPFLLYSLVTNVIR